MFRVFNVAFCIVVVAGLDPAIAQVPSPAATPAASPAQAQSPPPATRPARPVPPTRDPNTPGYVSGKDLPDGANAPINADGNFILGPTHNPAPEMAVQEGVPQGEIINFTMASADSKIYPGIAREPNTFGTADP